MINIEQVYHDYLLHKSGEHKKKYTKYKGWFSASTAGSCFRKQWYKINGYEEILPDERPMRLMRLGTLVHKDLEEAVLRYKNVNKDDLKEIEIYSEHRIILDDLKVVGHLDLALFTDDDNKLYVYDIKTAHSFKWKKLFGRNIDPNPSVNYQLQLGTYALGMMSLLNLSDEDEDSVELGLIWYRKDDSMMKIQTISNEWIKNAFYYWVELNEALEEEGKPKIGSHNTPIYNWECRYCPYHKIHCKGI